MLDVTKTKALLTEYGVDAELVYYDITDSTNTRARELARGRNRKTPCVIVADAQTAGRGRRGRSFYSEPECGLYVSFLLYPEDKGEEATTVTARAAVALRRAVARVAGLEADVKWVNDLYSGGKKLAGILAESEMGSDGEIAALVVGMGINVYKIDYPAEISHIATSIEAQTGKRVSREELLACLCREMLCVISDSDEVYSEYVAASMLVSRRVTVFGSAEPYEATVEGVARDYSLLVRTDGGERVRLFSGEVSVRDTELLSTVGRPE